MLFSGHESRSSAIVKGGSVDHDDDGKVLAVADSCQTGKDQRQLLPRSPCDVMIDEICDTLHDRMRDTLYELFIFRRPHIYEGFSSRDSDHLGFGWIRGNSQ